MEQDPGKVQELLDTMAAEALQASPAVPLVSTLDVVMVALVRCACARACPH
jgi:hypothetical protein